MPQFNLGETSGPELRRLLYASRKRGDTALQQEVLRELNARGAAPPEARSFAARPERLEDFPSGEPVTSGSDARPAVDNGRLPFGRFRAEPRLAASPYEGELKAAEMGSAVPAAPPARRAGRPANLALMSVGAIAVAGLGVWLAQIAGTRHRPASMVSPAAVATASPSTDRGEGVETELAAGEAPPQRRGVVVIPSSATPSPEAAAVPAAPASAATARTETRPLPPPPPLPPTQRAPEPTGQVASPVRVFIHVTDEAQTPTVDRVRAELSGLRFGGERVGMPPVRIVDRGPRMTEIRCLKHADCAAANQIARRLAISLGTRVAVADMSGTYERDPQVRPGSLELWLRPESGARR